MQMIFRTAVQKEKGLPVISHQDKLLMLGSCFTNNIGAYLQRSKFHCEVNPFGTLYNPISVANGLTLLFGNKKIQEKDLFYHKERWRSFLFHGDYTGSTQQEALTLMNNQVIRGREALKEVSYLLITFGSAWVFEYVENQEVVANCHKIPSKMFKRRRLSVEEIVVFYEKLLASVLCNNSACKVIFTVSPIRHIRDGLHENQLSKSILLLAIEQIVSKNPSQLFYFPAYELLLDDLRDYRFYSADMIHPSPTAIQYIWSFFQDQFFNTETTDLIKACEAIQKKIEHRPSNPKSAEYRGFLEQILLNISAVQRKYPNLDFENELKLCHTRLNL